MTFQSKDTHTCASEYAHAQQIERRQVNKNSHSLFIPKIIEFKIYKTLHYATKARTYHPISLNITLYKL